MSVHLCFVTPGHIASNPRLVKEAAAASAAGYRVSLVLSQHLPGLLPHDQAILDRYPEWHVTPVRWSGGTAREQAVRLWSGLRQRSARALTRGLGPRWGAVRAQGRLHDELLRAAVARRADLYIAHYIEALPVAARAARRHGMRYAFDAEDFHRGERADSPENRAERAWVKWIEARYLPGCAYVTAASEGIAAAYGSVLDIPTPTTILNVFPLAERDEPVEAALLAAEKPEGVRSLFWFSQTIGPERGLETALDALPLLPEEVVLSLRGSWAAGYEEAFRARAAALGVAGRVRHLPPVPAAQLVPLTARHDVGLALEQREPLNRDLCLTNKLFTYLIAGIPAVATGTRGQRPVAQTVPDAVSLVAQGDNGALAVAVRALLARGEAARHAAREVAESRYNWEFEQAKLLGIWRSLLPSG